MGKPSQYVWEQVAHLIQWRHCHLKTTGYQSRVEGSPLFASIGYSPESAPLPGEGGSPSLVAQHLYAPQGFKEQLNASILSGNGAIFAPAGQSPRWVSTPSQQEPKLEPKGCGNIITSAQMLIQVRGVRAITDVSSMLPYCWLAGEEALKGVRLSHPCFALPGGWDFSFLLWLVGVFLWWLVFVFCLGLLFWFCFCFRTYSWTYVWVRRVSLRLFNLDCRYPRDQLQPARKKKGRVWLCSWLSRCTKASGRDWPGWMCCLDSNGACPDTVCRLYCSAYMWLDSGMALIGEWTSQKIFSPSAGEWPRHGYSKNLLDDFDFRRPPILTWARACFEQGSVHVASCGKCNLLCLARWSHVPSPATGSWGH